MSPELRELLVNMRFNQRRLMRMASQVFGSVGYTQFAAELLKLVEESDGVWTDFSVRHPDTEWWPEE